MSDVEHTTRAHARPTVSSAIDEFLPLIKRIEEAVEKAKIIADRINGPMLRTVEKAETDDPSVPSALIHTIHAYRSREEKHLDALHRQIDLIREGLFSD